MYQWQNWGTWEKTGAARPGPSLEPRLRLLLKLKDSANTNDPRAGRRVFSDNNDRVIPTWLSDRSPQTWNGSAVDRPVVRSLPSPSIHYLDTFARRWFQLELMDKKRKSAP